MRAIHAPAVAVAFCLAFSTAYAGEPEWKLHDPVVIHSDAPPPGARFLWLAPVGICWLKDGPVLASVRGIKSDPSLELWGEKNERTWAKGEPITKPVKLDDPASFITLAAAGKRVAMSYIETLGSWSSGEMQCRLAVSQDGGGTWGHKPLDRYYKGVALFSALGGSPSGDRLLFSTAICIDPKGDDTNFLVVQEYSARPVRSEGPLKPEEKKEIGKLISALGDESWHVRDEATRKLAAFGRKAKTQLLSAAKNTDDLEVKHRIQLVLKAVFPACVRISGEED